MEEFGLKRFIKTAYCKKWYILGIIIISVIIGYLYSYVYNIPKYKSSTTIVLTAISDDNENKATNSITQSDITINQNLVDTYTEIIKSNKILRQTIQNLSLEIDEKDLAKMITVEAVNNTEILNIIVINEDPNMSKVIANEIAGIFSEKVKEIYNINNVNIIDEAEEAEEPYNISHIRDIAISIIIGISASVGFVFLAYMLDTTIKQEEDIEDNVKLSVLGTIPFKQDTNSINGAEIKSDTSVNEAFRTLRTNLTFAKKNENLKNILITSSYMSEGKSYVSSNLAVSLSRTNKRVLLIDSDMRKGKVHNIFELDNIKGLSNCLSEVENISENNVKKYIKTTNIPNLHVITSGERTKSPLELLSSNKFVELMKLLDKIYDVIVIDGTPSILVSDSIALAKFVDTVIVVAAHRTTKIENLQKVKKLLENVGAQITGVVLNKYPISESAYGKGYYSDVSEETIKEETGNTRIKTVEEIIKEANTDKIQEMTIPKQEELENKNNLKKDIINKDINKNIEKETQNQDNFFVQYKMENISSELSNIKSLFIEYIVNNKSASKVDIQNLSEEIEILKEKIENSSSKENLKEMKKEIESVKSVTENLLSLQQKNNENVKKFLENYKKR